MYEMEQAADYPGSSQGEVGTMEEQGHAEREMKAWIVEYLEISGLDAIEASNFADRVISKADNYIDMIREDKG